MKALTGIVTIIAIFGIAGLGAAQDASRGDTEGLALIAASARGDENAVRKSLDAHPSLLNATDALRMTALDWAATRGHWHLFRYLLAKHASVSNVGFDGGTVLHRVSHYDRPGEVRALLQAGADVTARNSWGRTPLHVAVRRGCDSVAALLLASGADPNVGTNEGWTPLHVAYLGGHRQMVELLRTAGADPQRTDSAGRRPEEYAFARPTEVPIEPADLYEYQGLYDVDTDFHFKVWVADGKLRIQDFASDDLYPTAPDSFYCRSEPWSVRFTRDAGAEVNGIEVHFLRRAVRGVKRNQPQYVGSDACKQCHLSQASGNQFVVWLSSRHAGAYWRLATEWAQFLALQQPHYQDVSDPLMDDRCLMCHTTGAQDPDALFASTFDIQQGVGCEACHGPGSAYIDPQIMADRAAFLRAGGRVPDENTCRRCHRNPDRFSFAQWWPRIAHSR
jgi:ankyrin repeat protein